MNPTRKQIERRARSGKVWEQAELAGRDLSGLDLSDAKFYIVDFRGANLSGACLRKAVIRMGMFQDANLGSVPRQLR